MKEIEISNKLVLIISEQFNRDTDTISLGDRFKDDYDADSIDFIELIMACEEEFQISISAEAAENFTTVQDAVTYLGSVITSS